MAAYIGSFADGFIKSFLAAQNLKMHKQYYAMRQAMFDFQMRQANYDPKSGKFYSYRDNAFTADSPAQSQREAVQWWRDQQPKGGGWGQSDTPGVSPGSQNEGNPNEAPGDPGKYKDLIEGAAKKYALDPEMFTRQLWKESRFNPNAKSPAGALGLAQFMPDTAKERHVDVNDPASSIEGAARYVSDLRDKYNGNVGLAFAGYNGGPGTVDNWLSGRGNLKPETQDYVKYITGKDVNYWRQGGPSTTETGAPGPQASIQPAAYSGSSGLDLMTTPIWDVGKGTGFAQGGEVVPVVDPFERDTEEARIRDQMSSRPPTIEEQRRAAQHQPPMPPQEDMSYWLRKERAQHSGRPDMPYGAHSGSPDMPYGAHSGSPDMPYGAHSGRPNTPYGAHSGIDHAPASPMMPPRTPTPTNTTGVPSSASNDDMSTWPKDKYGTPITPPGWVPPEYRKAQPQVTSTPTTSDNTPLPPPRPVPMNAPTPPPRPSDLSPPQPQAQPYQGVRPVTGIARSPMPLPETTPMGYPDTSWVPHNTPTTGS